MLDKETNTKADRKLKLLFHLPGLVDGGAERVTADLASQFASKGHNVLLAVDFAAEKNSPPLGKGVRLVQLPQGHKNSIKKLARLLAMMQPDIALSAIASANFKLVLAALLVRSNHFFKRSQPALKTRLVLTYHGFDEHQTGWLSWLGFVTLPLISRMSAKTVAVSDALQRELGKRWRAKSSNLMRIYNPVSIPAPPENYDPSSLDAAQLAKRQNIILAVGRLVPGKRFELLIEALARLRDKNTRLIILGEGEERNKLQDLIKKRGLEQRVELPGYAAQTGQYYAKAKCFALVSKSESFGLVLVEALAFGLPVISSDCGGPREVLDNGRYGVLLNPDMETDELAEQLQAALDDPGDPQPRRERARHFDAQSGGQQYLELFRNILDDKPPS